MKKLLLVVLLLAAALYLASQRYTVLTARSAEGTYKVIIVNTKSGAIHKILGS